MTYAPLSNMGIDGALAANPSLAEVFGLPAEDRMAASGDPFDDFDDDDFDDEFDDDFEEEWDDDLPGDEDQFEPDEKKEGGDEFSDDPDFDDE